MLDSYSETGGARWGQSFWLSTVATWPFAQLTVTKDYIELSVLKMKKFHFERETVQEICLVRRLWSEGIVIVHTKREYPEYVAFGRFSVRPLKSNLEKFGYPVKESPCGTQTRGG